MCSVEAKVVILGSQGVGKTSFINRYVGHLFDEHPTPTVGASFFSCNIDIEQHTLKLLIWDTAGQERFRSMAPLYYRKANAAILMFDLSSRSSYEDTKYWIQELNRNVEEPIIICLVGNKCDMTSLRSIKIREASEYASSIGALYHEASALSREGIEAVFIDIAQELLQHELKSKANTSYASRTFKDGKVNRLSRDTSRISAVAEEEKSFFCC